VLLQNRDTVPADILIIATPPQAEGTLKSPTNIVRGDEFSPTPALVLPSSKVFIQTASLDGETNLKPRQAIPLFQKIPISQLFEYLDPLQANSADVTQGLIIDSELPRGSLEDFDGLVELFDTTDKNKQGFPNPPRQGVS